MSLKLNPCQLSQASTILRILQAKSEKRKFLYVFTEGYTPKCSLTPTDSPANNNTQGLSAFLRLMLTSDLPGRDRPQEDLTAGAPYCIEVNIVWLSKSHLIPLVAPELIIPLPPPAEQLCAAATSLFAPGVDAQSGGALLSHQNPPSAPEMRSCDWLRAALDTSLRFLCASSECFSWRTVFFFLLFLFFLFFFVFSGTSLNPTSFPKSGGTLSVAQRDSAVSDYKPCAVEPPAQSASLWGRK